MYSAAAQEEEAKGQ
jgi:hypothetical protein